MIFVPSLVVVISILSLADALPGGAPGAACDTLMPQHAGIPPQTDAVPYSIDLSPFSDGNGGFQYTPGQQYTCETNTCGLLIIIEFQYVARDKCSPDA